MNRISIETARRLQELGAWEGRQRQPLDEVINGTGYIGPRLSFSFRNAAQYPLLPTLPDLLDALTAKGQPHLWLWSSDALPRVGWHCEVGIRSADSSPRCATVVWWPGDGDTVDAAAAACLVAVLEAKAEIERLTAENETVRRLLSSPVDNFDSSIDSLRKEHEKESNE